MLNVFLDLKKLTSATLGDKNGDRCAMGHVLWTIGVPHDQLLNIGTLEGIGEKHLWECFIKLGPESFEIAYKIYNASDALYYALNNMDINLAKFWAEKLIALGKIISINFIIASHLPLNILRHAETRVELVSSQ